MTMDQVLNAPAAVKARGGMEVLRTAEGDALARIGTAFESELWSSPNNDSAIGAIG